MYNNVPLEVQEALNVPNLSREFVSLDKFSLYVLLSAARVLLDEDPTIPFLKEVTDHTDILVLGFVLE